MVTKIIIGSDHGGFKLKESVKKYIEEKGIEIDDYGCSSEESCDYPDIGLKVAEVVAEANSDDIRGILVCGTGIGMSMAANKIKGIRATLCHNEFTAEMSRKHNNSNILVMGGRVLDEDLALKIVEIWLNTKFEGERHQKRLDKILKAEGKE
ncbi:ribose 5-phosphate isomerase B [Nanoarchaeota archaeon]